MSKAYRKPCRTRKKVSDRGELGTALTKEIDRKEKQMENLSKKLYMTMITMIVDNHSNPNKQLPIKLQHV